LEILLLLLLMISVAVLYLPSIMKERALGSPLDTVSDFRRGMLALASSTRRIGPRMARRYDYSPSSQNEPEPYFRRSRYGDDADYAREEDSEDFIPYLSNKSQALMETRRQRIMMSLLIVALGTGILALIPKLKWILPIHVVVLVLLATYTLLVIFLPYYNRDH